MRLPGTMLFLAMASLLVGATPTPPVVTDAETELLKVGKMVIRTNVDDQPYKMMGIVDLPVTQARLWEEILDFDARLAENKPAKDYEVYKDYTEGSVRHIFARWDLKILGQDITYYNHYRYDASESHFWFSLDPDLESDIAKADGYYLIVPSPIWEGGSRFIYMAETDSGRKMPDSIRSWLANHAMKDMLKAIQRRAIE